jgi:S-adenosylmethionine:tRNA ribosyltransferase-isomerase
MLPIAEYDYHLPPDLIAQTPLEPRDHSRLLVLPRDGTDLEHRHFYDILRYLRPGDVLVANDSRVLPARLYGHKASGGRTEALLLRQLDPLRWEALIKGKVAVDMALIFGDEADDTLPAVVEELLPSGTRILRFDQPIEQRLAAIGVMPLPPYITAPLANPERYQTVYSAATGSAAAPTAGLHWTPALIERVQALGVTWATVTLHVGLDTFRPVQTDNALDHTMHSEWYDLPAATAAAINQARASGGRVIAVGTTSVRVLETVGRNQPAGALAPESGWTDIFIYPPYQFRLVEGLITNFHLPRSTLLLLVSALAGRERIFRAYAEAVAERYRFFSFGDAMLII